MPDDPPAPPDTRVILFDSTPVTFANWQVLGGGAFRMVEGLIVTEPGNDMGLCYYAARPFADFILQVQFRLERGNENSGVWVRSRDPRRPVPDRNDPNRTHAYDNPAYVPVDTGFEIQIDELARGNPLKGTMDGAEEHRPGPSTMSRRVRPPDSSDVRERLGSNPARGMTISSRCGEKSTARN